MYQWLVFAHVLGVLGFLTAHGSSAAVAFKVRRERDLARVRVLLELSQGANMVGNVCLLVFLVAGIILGFLGNWWGQYWIWAALGALIALAVAMTVFGSGPLIRIRRLLEDSATPDGDVEKQLPGLLAATHPWLLTALGGAGLAIILWLMLFKPF